MASANAAAAHIFIGIARFRELTEQGAITKQARGQYDLAVVRREAFAALRADRGGHGTAELSTERAALAREQTLTARIKNAAASGDLVSLPAVGKKLEGLFAIFRERALSLPGKCADGLQPFILKDRGQITDILRDEVYEMLETLSATDVTNAGSKAREGERFKVARV